MKRNKYFFLIVCCLFIMDNMVVLSAKCSTDPIVSFQKNEDKFRIVRIKSVNSLYLIYAVRNDTLYKIISEKDKTKFPDLGKIKKGESYNLSLETLFPRYIHQTQCPPPGSTGRMIRNYKGADVSIETENNIWDVFKATNLRGLYIIEELDQSHIELFDKPLE